MPLETAYTTYHCADLAAYVSWLRGLAAGRGPVTEGEQVAPDAAPAVAYANHGRWVADCPSGCGGAMLLEPGAPYLCGHCWNAEIGGRWRRVAWPRARRAIETLLLARPLAHTRNWQPGETLADLRAENAARGLGD